MSHPLPRLPVSVHAWLRILLTIWVCPQQGRALLPYGAGAGDTWITSERSSELSLSPPFPFYGQKLSSVVVYKDAFLCFDASWRDIYMLENGADVNFPAISAWSSNIKTVSDSGAGTVSYRLTTNETVLDLLSTLARSFSEFSRTFYPRYALVVTWDSVGTIHYHPDIRDKANTFQTVLASDGRESLVLMDYIQIQWIHDESEEFYDDGGTLETVASTKAQVGFYKGDGLTKYLLPSSFRADIRFITSMSNINQSGLYMFRVDTLPQNLTVYTETSTTSFASTITSWTESITTATSTSMPKESRTATLNSRSAPTAAVGVTETANDTSASKRVSATSAAINVTKAETTTTTRVLTTSRRANLTSSAIISAASATASTSESTTIPAATAETETSAIMTALLTRTTKITSLAPLSTNNLSKITAVTKTASTLSPTMATSATKEAAKAMIEKDNRTSTAVVGMGVACAFMVAMFAVSALVASRLKNRKINLSLSDARMATETPAPGCGESRTQGPSSFKIPRLRLHNGWSTVSPTRIQGVQY